MFSKPGHNKIGFQQAFYIVWTSFYGNEYIITILLFGPFFSVPYLEF